MPQRKQLTQDIEELKHAMMNSSNKDEYRRLHCIYLAATQPDMTIKEIAAITLYSERMVNYIYLAFRKDGFKSVKDKRGGRFRENLSLEEESKLLKRFAEHSESCKLICATVIKSEYEKVINRQVNKSVIYRLLFRHGYRKIVPYKRHHESNQEEQSTFKKTSEQ